MELFDEFMDRAQEESEMQETEVPETDIPEVDVQKVVVEELAAEKAHMAEELAELRRQLATSEGIVKATQAQKENLEAQVGALKKQVANLERQLADEQLKTLDVQERNPNALALLDRDVEVPDRFPGETRDHIIDVVREAKEKAEQEGRLRKAQLLESVLIANEPSGNLQKKRAALEKFLEENHNVLNGTVINELEKYGIKYKDGDKYLLIGEIINRNY
jgi:hypothetical protein